MNLHSPVTWTDALVALNLFDFIVFSILIIKQQMTLKHYNDSMPTQPQNTHASASNKDCFVSVWLFALNLPVFAFASDSMICLSVSHIATHIPSARNVLLLTTCDSKTLADLPKQMHTRTPKIPTDFIFPSKYALSCQRFSCVGHICTRENHRAWPMLHANANIVTICIQITTAETLHVNNTKH